MESFNVLSLFDGISCGQIALNRAGIKYDKYFASEIDKHAIKVTQHNYPETIQLGDIKNWRNWGIDFSKIDLLFAGFPCQAWSVAGKQKGVEDPRGELVYVLLDIFNHIKEVNPKLLFLFENVKMKKEYLDFINNLFGVKPIEINSALVSAQNRKRLYWTNIKDTQTPENKDVKLQDILDSGYQVKDKSNCVMASANPSNRKSFLGRFFNKSMGNCKYKTENKEGGVEILTCIETERLQTLPDGYTGCISNLQRYKSIGNGWTVDVIAHILTGIKSDKV